MISRRSILIGGGVTAAAVAGGAVYSVASMGSMAEYDAAMAALRAPLPPGADVQGLLRYATLAANRHNTQPWKFRAAAGRIDILPDLARRTPVVDPDDHHLWASLGCAAENLALAAAAQGMPGEIRFDAGGDGAVVFEYVEGPAQNSDLFGAIPLRQSVRAAYDGRSVSADLLSALAAGSAVASVDMVLLTARADR